MSTSTSRSTPRTPEVSETLRWHAESTTVTSTTTAEAPEPKPTNGVLANGTKTNGTSSNGVHEPAKTASKPEAPVVTPKPKRRWGIFGRAK